MNVCYNQHINTDTDGPALAISAYVLLILTFSLFDLYIDSL